MTDDLVAPVVAYTAVVGGQNEAGAKTEILDTSGLNYDSVVALASTALINAQQIQGVETEQKQFVKDVIEDYKERRKTATTEIID